VKNDGSTNAPANADAPATTVEPTESAWMRFWFTPMPTTGLHALRVLSGLLFLAWLLSFLGHQREFFSLTGWFGKEAYVEVQRQGNLAPAPIGWSMLYLADESVEMFQAMYWGSLVVLALFTIGVATRITGVLTWVIVVSFLANPAINYDGDYMLGILAFYMALVHLYVGQWSRDLSIPARILGSRGDMLLANRLFPDDAPPAPSFAANFVLRLMQIHFVIIMLTSGLHKLQIPEWWSGVAFWIPLHPTFKTTLESLERERPGAAFTLFYLSLAQYLVLAWQIGLPMFAWRAGWWRVALVGGAIVGWVGGFYIYQLPLFGPFMVIMALSYLTPEEWKAVMERLRPRASETAEAQAVASEPVAVGSGAWKQGVKK